jgi:hypothetical protein
MHAWRSMTFVIGNMFNKLWHEYPRVIVAISSFDLLSIKHPKIDWD